MIEIIEGVLEEEGLSQLDLAMSIYVQLFVVVEDAPMGKGELNWIGRIDRAVSKLETELDDANGTKLDSYRNGRVEELRELLEKFKADIAKLYPRRASNRPQSDVGRMSSELYRILVEAGVRDAWKCSQIIARILVRTEISDSSEEKLTKSVYDRLQRQLVR